MVVLKRLSTVGVGVAWVEDRVRERYIHNLYYHTNRRSNMAEVFACLVYVLDGSTVSIDVNVSVFRC